MLARYQRQQQRKQQRPSSTVTREFGMNIKLLIIISLASLAVWFVAQNAAVVELSFLFWSFPVSSALLIFFTLLTGFVLGWLLHSYRAYRKSVDEYNFLR